MCCVVHYVHCLIAFVGLVKAGPLASSNGGVMASPLPAGAITCTREICRNGN